MTSQGPSTSAEPSVAATDMAVRPVLQIGGSGLGEGGLDLEAVDLSVGPTNSARMAV